MMAALGGGGDGPRLDDSPGGWPDARTLDSVAPDEALRVAKAALPLLQQLFEGNDADFLHPDAYWRDLFGLTWTTHTFHTSPVIATELTHLVQRVALDVPSLHFVESEVAAPVLPNGVSFVRIPFTFRTRRPDAACLGSAKVVRMLDGTIKLFVLSTSLQSLASTPWTPMPPPLPPISPPAGRLPTQTDILVIGASTAGLSLGAYLRSLGLEFLMVDQVESMAKSWSGHRYDSVRLHTPRFSSGLPFAGFPEEFPMYVPGSQVSRYYADYARTMHLPIFLGRKVERADWRPSDRTWSVRLGGPDGIESVECRYIVFAIGVISRHPLMPHFPAMSSFQGTIVHSVDVANASQWRGKRVVVIGTSTSGFDIALDCLNAGAEVTMVQRSPAHIMPQPAVEMMHRKLWADQPVEVGDTVSNENPLILGSRLSRLARQSMVANNRDLFDGLEQAGLKTAISSIEDMTWWRAGNFYIDVGGCEAVIRGDIKIKSDAPLQGFDQSGLAFADGSHLDADVVVCATGFSRDIRENIAAIVGDEHVAGMSGIWGLTDGEISELHKPFSTHSHLYATGGQMMMCRYFPRFVALQLAAQLRGEKPEPYQRGNAGDVQNMNT